MSESSRTPTGRKTAGAFDVRTIIGALLTTYGLILLLLGLFADQPDEMSGDINANLWAGLAMLVVGIGFVAWARLRPIVVADTDRHGDYNEPPTP